jgi:hypothetical protein
MSSTSEIRNDPRRRHHGRHEKWAATGLDDSPTDLFNPRLQDHKRLADKALYPSEVPECPGPARSSNGQYENQIAAQSGDRGPRYRDHHTRASGHHDRLLAGHSPAPARPHRRGPPAHRPVSATGQGVSASSRRDRRAALDHCGTAEARDVAGSVVSSRSSGVPPPRWPAGAPVSSRWSGMVSRSE